MHDFPTGLRGTIFVGVRTLEPVLLDSEDVSAMLKDALVQIKGAKGVRTKQLRVPLDSTEDASGSPSWCGSNGSSNWPGPDKKGIRQ